MRVHKKWFISFVEESVLNPLYHDFVGGRVEVHESGADYASEEIRFFTNKLSEFYRLRDEYDFKEVGAVGLEQLRRELKAYRTEIV